MTGTFESTKVNINKIIINDAPSTSSISLSEFQTMISSGVLQELDAQIGMHKSEIEAKNDKKAALRNDIISVNTLLSKESNEPVTFWNQKLKAEYAKSGSVQTAPTYTETAIPISSEQTKELILVTKKLGLYDELRSNVGFPNNGKSKDDNGKAQQRYITKTFLEQLKETFDNELTDLNGQTETDTIRFQALMDARKQNLLLLSNMISSDNQTKMAIINNMK